MTSVQNITNNSSGATKRAPHRLSAYAFFQKDAEMRLKVKESLGENPNFGEISKAMSQKWKSLTSDEKSKYQVLSEQAKTSQMSQTVQSSQSSESSSLNTKSVKKPKNKKRKRARTAYILYTMDEKVKGQVKQDNPDADFGELSKLLGAKWKLLTAEEKKPYEQESERKG